VKPLERIVVSGASGSVGSHLVRFVSSAGSRADALVRRPPRPGSTEIRWDPARGEIDVAALEGADAVVHLSGENVAGRWTTEKKSAIHTSRVGSTGFLCDTLAKLRNPPHVLIAASATGYYGDRGDEPVDEDSRRGSGFLADVCGQWEAATQSAAKAGIRVVNLRIGIVLSPDGGALARMLTPFRMGMGGVVGSGRQWMSWIAIKDLLRLIEHAMVTDSLRGPVNAVSPTPVTNAEFVQTLGRVLRRPTLIPLPALAVRALFGEMGESLLLSSARVTPSRAIAAGFRFDFPELEYALRHALDAE
jgi:hypothetical protein